MENMNVEELMNLYYQYRYYYSEIISCREKLLAITNSSNMTRQEKTRLFNMLTNLENEFRHKLDAVILAARVIEDERNENEIDLI